MTTNQPPRIMLVVYPIQSHMTPALHFADHLLRSGALVTIATTIAGTHRMSTSGSAPANLSFASISDGYDHGLNSPIPSHDDTDAYLSSLRLLGSKSLSALLSAASPPYTRVVYTFILAWVADVARRHHLPSALLWNQNAALLSIYYHYFNGYGDVIDKIDENDPAWTVKLPFMPPLHARDIPSMITASNPNKPFLKDHFEELKKDENPTVLVNTFDSLEREVLESFNGFFKMSAIGPLLAETSSGFRVDMVKGKEEDYVAWLDTKADSSVVYVSFGSVAVLSRAQLEELAAALLDTGRPFLWVMRPKTEAEKGGGEEEEERVSRWEELREKGMVVAWCSQIEVLSHRAVGCFVTHCGWNSTLESLAAGVPVVAMPQWTDQLTNAKMLETGWGTGMRVNAEEEKVVGREEIRRCVEEVMESEETRGNAKKWREMAVEAAKEGGSSEVNLRGFVQEIWRMSKSPV